MKLVNSNFEIIEQKSGLEGIYKQIEIGGRICYKSEDKITEGSAKKFFDMVKDRGHLSVTEHGTVYLKIHWTYEKAKYFDNIYDFFEKNHYSKCKRVIIEDDLCPDLFITTNYRVLIESFNDKEISELLEYLCEPTKYHEKRITVKFYCDIGVSREANRHRANSVSEQSTRYCNYSKEKFNNEISITCPNEIDKEEVETHIRNWGDGTQNSCFRYMCDALYENDDINFGVIDTWLFANLACEWAYKHLIELGWKPQQARRVLPLDTSTEVVYTAYVSDWEHFFSLRTSNAAHPDIAAIAIPLKEEFIKRGYVKS